jgi:hypothetical protein
MKPTVGRIVNYTESGHIYCAIITHVFSDITINLCIFNDGSYPIGGSGESVVMKTSVSRADESLGDSNIGSSYTWHWPVRI